MEPQPRPAPGRTHARALRGLVAGTLVLLLALAAWVAAGPWLAVRGIERAIAAAGKRRIQQGQHPARIAGIEPPRLDRRGQGQVPDLEMGS